MSRTKQFLSSVLLGFVTILAFLFGEPLFDWAKNGTYQITDKGAEFAIFMGIVLPVVLFLSKKVKNHLLFILVFIVVVVLAALLKNLISAV